jgi:hypothetical protein
MDSFGRDLGCLIRGMIATITVLAVAVIGLLMALVSNG